MKNPPLGPQLIAQRLLAWWHHSEQRKNLAIHVLLNMGTTIPTKKRNAVLVEKNNYEWQ
jgi:hypothetical protein